MNWLDRRISWIAPSWGLKRAQARQMMGAYEAIKPGRNRKIRTEARGPETVQQEGGEFIRTMARALDENYDLVTGALDTLVMRIVGPRGIAVEPMVRSKDGTLHDAFNQRLSELYAQWRQAPDVTQELTGALCEQLAARSWLRDGEMFLHLVKGRNFGLPSTIGVPFFLELLEADFCPYTYQGTTASGFEITQGVEKNQWRRPFAYWIYKKHPGDNLWTLPKPADLKRVSADEMLHLKLTKRLGQTRGISLFHAVITRIEDLKDYEESERVAARIAAAAAFYIKKGNPDTYVADDQSGDRTFKVQPGTIFDTLQPGEEVGSIQSNRPSAMLEPFRNAMVRMFAAGTRISYSSASKNYDGTYSAQRQELVEQFDHYNTLQNHFVSKYTRPVYEMFVNIAITAGAIIVPPDVDIATLTRAHYQGPSMPWIDPLKEGQANEINVKAGFITRSSVIRSRGESPLDVDAQLQRERQREKDLDLVLTSNAANSLTTAPGAANAAPDPNQPQQSESAPAAARTR